MDFPLSGGRFITSGILHHRLCFFCLRHLSSGGRNVKQKEKNHHSPHTFPFLAILFSYILGQHRPKLSQGDGTARVPFAQAQAHGQAVLPGPSTVGPPDGFFEPLHSVARLVLPVVEHENGELVPAYPSRDVRYTECFPENGGRFPEDFIPLLVTGGFVQFLKPSDRRKGMSPEAILVHYLSPFLFFNKEFFLL